MWNEPEGIRTPDPRLRRPLLYPTELQTHKRVMGIEPTYLAWKASVLPLNYTRKGNSKSISNVLSRVQCPKSESNQRHEDFQSSALPTELSGQTCDVPVRIRNQFRLTAPLTHNTNKFTRFPFICQEKFNLITHIFYKTAHHTGPSSTSSNCSTGIGL